MSQSAYIFAALLAGFIVFLAAKGRLATYAQVFVGTQAQAVPSKSGGSGLADTVGQTLKNVDVGSTNLSFGQAILHAFGIG